MAQLAEQLAELETTLCQALLEAPEALTEISAALGGDDPWSATVTPAVAERLRAVSREADSTLVRVTGRQTPTPEEVRLVLSLVQLAQHGVLISNQFGLISDQLEPIDATIIDRSGAGATVSEMALLAGRQLQAAVTAFATRDKQLAQQIDAQDDAIDQLNRDVFQSAADQDADAGERELVMRYVLIARSLERIGDNAVDIAEQAAFLISGELHQFTDASQPRVRPRRR